MRKKQNSVWSYLGWNTLFAAFQSGVKLDRKMWSWTKAYLRKMKIQNGGFGNWSLELFIAVLFV